MLSAINKDDRFTEGQYNILRVVAAYPLAASFSSPSHVIERALMDDKHALAVLPRSSLIEVLSNLPCGKSIIEWLDNALKLKRTRDEVDDEAKIGQPASKKKETT